MVIVKVRAHERVVSVAGRACEELSLEALGLLTKLAGLTGQARGMPALARDCGLSEEKLSRLFAELARTGFARLRRVRLASGRLCGSYWEVDPLGFPETSPESITEDTPQDNPPPATVDANTDLNGSSTETREIPVPVEPASAADFRNGPAWEMRPVAHFTGTGIFRVPGNAGSRWEAGPGAGARLAPVWQSSSWPHGVDFRFSLYSPRAQIFEAWPAKGYPISLAISSSASFSEVFELPLFGGENPKGSPRQRNPSDCAGHLGEGGDLISGEKKEKRRGCGGRKKEEEGPPSPKGRKGSGYNHKPVPKWNAADFTAYISVQLRARARPPALPKAAMGQHVKMLLEWAEARFGPQNARVALKELIDFYLDDERFHGTGFLLREAEWFFSRWQPPLEEEQEGGDR